jgi:Protein of unknown function (DUF4236)
MGLRFRKSFKVAPGVRLSVGKKGVGASFGGKGLRYSVHSSGKRRTTVGIPGSGISYSSTSGSSKSYKSSAYKRQRELERQLKEQQKLDQLQQARLTVEQYENTIERIQFIHIESDEQVDWNDIKASEPPYHKEYGEMGPKEKSAIQKEDNYKPGLLTKLFKKEEKEHAKLRETVFAARKEDENSYQEWEETVHVAKKVMEGDIDTYFQVIEEFDPLDDLSEFGSGFEFGSDDPTMMEIEFEVHGESVVPKEQLSLTKTGKVSMKAMPKGKYYEILQDYVCSCCIRIARDMFALLPLETVIIHATEDQMNSSTGHNENVTILSVEINRTTLQSLNMNGIDCSDAMQNFEHQMKFKKTSGFQPVERITSKARISNE